MKTETLTRKENLKLLLVGCGLVAAIALLRVLTDLQAWYRRMKGSPEFN